MSWSSDLPVTPGAYQSSPAGSADLAVAKFDLPLLPWRVLGGGLEGLTDTPNLAGAGPLTPGSLTNRVSIRGGAPGALAWLAAGFTKLDQPLLGGTLVPSADLLLPFLTDATGALDFVFPWPALPSGTSLWAQVWIQDAGAVQGWSATNALELVGQ